MKIFIGSIKDKNIEEVIQQNIDNGYTIYFDNIDYYIDILTDKNSYTSPDCEYIKIPSGIYSIKNNKLYFLEDIKNLTVSK